MTETYTRRLSVSCSKKFKLSIEQLWDLISSPGNLNSSHPFCKSNDVISWDDEHKDRLEYLNGRTYIRNFQTWSPNKGYTLLIGEENGAQSYVVWDLEELSESESSLTITVYPFILAKLPKPLAYLPHILWVKPRLRSYLKSVVGGFHYYSTEGKSVPRNHFGRHKWFS